MKEYIVQAYAEETIRTFDGHGAPELIRCKDCKRGTWLERTGMTPMVTCGGEDHEPDWFCADGERR